MNKISTYLLLLTLLQIAPLSIAMFHCEKGFEPLNLEQAQNLVAKDPVRTRARIMRAAGCGNLERIELFLNAGVKDQDKIYALETAIIQKKQKAANELLKSINSNDPKMKDELKKVLKAAQRHKNQEIIDDLKKLGVTTGN